VATETIEGGIERTKVLYEIGTGTWCQYCPGAARGADDMVNNGHDVAIIEYHSGDEYENGTSIDRLSYYNVTAFPTTIVDGVLEHVGGQATGTLYTTYLNLYNQRKPIPSVHGMQLTMEHVSGDDYRATVKVKQEDGYFASDLVLHTALTESHIPDTWLSGLKEVNFVCRNMFPSSMGTPLDFTTSDSLTFTFDFSVTDFTFENLEFVAFVQHTPSKEVIQTNSFKMVYTGVKDNPKLALTLYPNPATDYITLQLNSTKAISYSITDIYGNVMMAMQPVKSELTKINTSNWASGVYVLKTNDGYSRKFTVVNR
jgi:hypothetical protein